MGDKVVFINLKVGRKGEDLLDLPHVTFECFDTCFRIQVPEFYCAVIGSGEERARRQINLHRIDPIAVPMQHEALVRVEVVDHDGAVGGSRCQQFIGHVDADDTSGVGLERIDALAGPPIPHFDRVVQASSDKASVIKVQASDSLCVPFSVVITMRAL